MNIRFYPPREGLTYEEIRRGDIWLYADVRCPHCGHDAPISNTHYVGGPCPRCGGLTSGATACPVVKPMGGDSPAVTPEGILSLSERFDVAEEFKKQVAKRTTARLKEKTDAAIVEAYTGYYLP